MKRSGIIVLMLVLTACFSSQTEKVVEAIETAVVDEANELVQQMIEVHGGQAYDSAQYSFVFRGVTYRFFNQGAHYSYEREGVIKGESIHDVLVNGSFSRTKNQQPIEVHDTDATKYSESVNSVIYFATLPHKLKDAAVLKELIGTTTVKGEPYHCVKVTFKQEGGGQDFQDEYCYWIHAEHKTLDYLAYNYQVNGGGVRFRSAYHRRRVEGIIFQDYVNYKAAVGTPLKQLSALWERGELEELSRIETENVTAL